MPRGLWETENYFYSKGFKKRLIRNGQPSFSKPTTPTVYDPDSFLLIVMNVLQITNAWYILLPPYTSYSSFTKNHYPNIVTRPENFQTCPSALDSASSLKLRSSYVTV
jgi:hypothetical protein